MKTLGIVGSPRGLNGNTGRLMMEVLKAAEAEGASVKAIALPGGTVLPCRACNTCHKKGYCPRKDDFENSKEEIIGSDGVVIASPYYIFNAGNPSPQSTVHGKNAATDGISQKRVAQRI